MSAPTTCGTTRTTGSRPTRGGPRTGCGCTATRRHARCGGSPARRPDGTAALGPCQPSPFPRPMPAHASGAYRVLKVPVVERAQHTELKRRRRGRAVDQAQAKVGRVAHLQVKEHARCVAAVGRRDLFRIGSRKSGETKRKAGCEWRNKKWRNKTGSRV